MSHRTNSIRAGYDPDLPCCGRLCNGKFVHHAVYQLCPGCDEHHARLKRDLAAKVNAYKRTFKGCPRCHVKIKEGNEMCFDLDHLDPYKKQHNVSHMIRQLASESVIDKEMRKCRLLCCHCHMDHTKSQRHIFQRQDFKDLRKHGTLVNRADPTFPDSSYSSDSSDSRDCGPEPEIRSEYNPLDDPSPEFKPPPLK